MSKKVSFKPRRHHSSLRKRRPVFLRRFGRRPPSLIVAFVCLAVVSSGLFYAYARLASHASIKGDDFDFSCASVSVTDGDTFRCGSTRVRMYGIDAPELEGHCRPGRRCVSGDPHASTRNLERLIAGRQVMCKSIDVDRYGRTVGRCFAGDVDLSCGQIEGGFAVRRYGNIWC